MKTSLLGNQILQVYCDVSSPSIRTSGYRFSYKAGTCFHIYYTDTLRFFTFKRATWDTYINVAYLGIWINTLYPEKNALFKKRS